MKSILIVISRHDSIIRHDTAAANIFLKDIMTKFSYFANIGATDRQGIVFASATPISGRIDLSDRLYVREAILKNKLACGEYQVGRITGVATINFGFPIINASGDISGVVYTAIKIEHLKTILSSIDVPDNSDLTFLDVNNTVLYSNLEKIYPPGSRFPENLLGKINSVSGNNTVTQHGKDGVMRIYTSRRFSELEGPTLVLGLPEQQAMARVNIITLRNIILLIIIAIAVLAVSRLLFNIFIIRRIDALVSVSDLIASGSYGSQTGISHSDDELGRLAASFDRMSISLKEYIDEKKQTEEIIKKNNQELQASNEEYESINEELISANEELEKSGNELHLAHSRLTAVINSMDAIVYIADMQSYEIFFINDYCRRIWGDITGMVCWKSIHGKQNGPCEFCTNDKLLDLDGRPAGVYSWEFHNPVNNRWYLCRDTAITWTDGKTVRMEIAADITDIKNKEQQLRQAQKMETVGNLAGGLAHDFNNVLSGITGTISLMKFNLKKNKFDPLEMIENIQVIEESASRAADIANQLLTLSRGHKLSLAPVDITESIGHVMKICKNSFDKTIEIKLQLSAGGIMIMADPAQIEQVVLNICVNAMHAMTIMRGANENQGGCLSVTTNFIYADDFFRTNHPEADAENYCIISISDNGVGMDSKTTAKIFDPFFTTKKLNQGTGLGLAMVYNIIKQHKGFIDVYSEQGVGTTFNIFLPELKEADSRQRLSEDQIFAVKGTGTILVLDDEDLLRRTARKMLEASGYSVVDFPDVDKAIEYYSNHYNEIKGVLLDMAMPKLSGKDVFERMKVINPDVKAIIVSGFMQDQRIEEALSSGVSGFLHKPYGMMSLTRIIKEIFG
ncbi:MAG: response regulator [Spirochaetes bacterium]|nr:response regulator [Spirochaetota bacterium]